MDRFMFKLLVHNPSLNELKGIVTMTQKTMGEVANEACNAAQLLEMRETANQIPVADEVLDFAMMLISATHPDSECASEAAKKYVRLGSSPRGGQALISAAKVKALMNGRFNVSYSDIASLAYPVLRHRMKMNFEAIAKQTDVKNLAEYRQIFEIGAIQLAAKCATEKNVTCLRKILKKMEEVPDDSVALSQYDFEFHAYLMKMTHNELLIVMFNSIRKAYKSLTESIFAMGCLPTTINEHLAIVDAIADHDPVLAAHMMQLHLSNVESFRSRQPTVIREASEK